MLEPITARKIGTYIYRRTTRIGVFISSSGNPVFASPILPGSGGTRSNQKSKRDGGATRFLIFDIGSSIENGNWKIGIIFVF